MDTKVFNLKKRVFLITIALVIGYFNNNFYGMDKNSDEKEKEIDGKGSKGSAVDFFLYISKAGWTNFLGSISYSVLNSFYNFEKITMNAWYKNIRILCFGYRWQPKIIASWDWFFDGNINIVGGLLNTIFTISMIYLKNPGMVNFLFSLNDNAKPLKLLICASYVNANLNIKIKETYIAINCISLIKVALYHTIFKEKVKKKEKEEEKELVKQQNDA